MVERLKLPDRRPPGIVSPPIQKVESKLYRDENFMLGLYVGIFSTILVILLCLILVGLIGAIVSSIK